MPREPLPVDEILPALTRALDAHGAAVLQAPTGSGKTTRVPPALLDHTPTGQVLLLQPRRVAARAAARRIASERGQQVGDEVGYQVRFERVASPRTRLLVVTEGILLRKLQDDPLLEDVAGIVFDEFHERNLASDLALALAARIRTDVRPDLALVVMSATLDPTPIAAFLGDAPILTCTSRTHPVTIEHAPRSPETGVEAAVRSAVLDVLPRHEGDLLVFLPGVGEIRRCRDALADVRAADVLELHGELPPEKQDAALRTGARRRIILATNVAETSLTLPGVRVVIDAGLERVPRLDPATGFERLEAVPISRASADQRAGRAGRTAPGVCVRLYSAAEDARLAAVRLP
ncbi:MAG: helicase-related protein, partial [Planctomycetota bacterium]|nr:helicase-related protein [Planctomycetota bacterium]